MQQDGRGDIDLDAIRPDLDAVDQGRKDRLDPLRCSGAQFICHLARALDQRLSSNTVVDLIVDGIKQFSSAGEECVKPLDHYGFRDCLPGYAGASIGSCRHR